LENETKNEENIEFFKKIAMLFLTFLALVFGGYCFWSLISTFCYGLKPFFFVIHWSLCFMKKSESNKKMTKQKKIIDR
jgi:hypothetical protein